MKFFDSAPIARCFLPESFGGSGHTEAESPPRPCRILFLVGQLVAGGLEQQIFYILKGMDRQRFLPALAVWNYRESDAHVAKIKALGVPIWGYPLAMSSYYKMYDLARLVRTLSPEVVHSYNYFTNFAAFWGARATGCVAVGSLRGELDMDLAKGRPLLGRVSAMLPRYQISNSDAAARRIESLGTWFKPKQLTVVSNGLDLERFGMHPVPIELPHSILGIGRLDRGKRWDRVVVAARELKRRGFSCIVQIAGEGPLRSELEALASSLGVSDTVRFLGYRSDVPELIAQARLIVHTSDAEGSPNAIMEALASGRPVVATDVGDVARLVEHGKTGFVVPREDPEALLARMIDLLSDDHLAIHMGCSAMEFARNTFSLHRLVEQTFDAYRSAGWKA